MGDLTESIPSDDSGLSDRDVAGDLASNFVVVPELQIASRSTASTISPKQNWFEEIKAILERHKAGPDAAEWILSNFHRWDHLSDLQDCEDLSPKQIRSLSSAMEDTFLSFTADKRILIEILNSEPLVYNPNVLPTFSFHFSKGKDHFWEFLTSENLKACVGEENEKRVLKLFFESVSQESESGVKSLDPLSEIEQILANFNLNEDALKEVLEKLQLHDDLARCLESCDELTRKQVHALEQQLKLVFHDLKNTTVASQMDKREIKAHVTKELMLSDEAITWIQDWLLKSEPSTSDLNEIENCEDLTKRQLSTLKERLSEFYKMGEKQKHSDPRDDFLKQLFQILVENNIEDLAQKWIIKEALHFETLNSLLECDDLSKTQARKLKIALEEPFNAYKAQCLEIEASCAQFLAETENDISEKVESTTSQRAKIDSNDYPEPDLMDLDNRASISVAPLILFHTEMQEDFLVEKFALSESGVKYICDLVPENQKGDTPVFYSSISGTPVIDFASLDKMKFHCVGLFGPFRAVLRNLQAYISESKLQIIEEDLKDQKAGLYLLNVLNKNRQFLIYYSQKDSDFLSVKKDSRAVHFLRYMSQLTNNVVMCLDEKSKDRLSNEGEKVVVKTDRRTKYNLKRDVLQEESFSLKNLGLLTRSLTSFLRLFSSESGLVAVKLERIAAKGRLNKSKRTGDVGEITKLIDSAQIEDVSLVCDEFKTSYLQRNCPNKLKDLECEIESEIEAMESSSKVRDEENLLVSVAIHLVKECELKDQFSIMEKYYKANPAETKNLWKNKIIPDLTWNGPISYNDLSDLKMQIKSKNDKKMVFKKFLLWNALENHKKGLPEGLLEKGFQDATLDDVNNCAKERFSSRIPYKTDKNIQSKIDETEKSINYSDPPGLLKTCVESFLDYICSLIEPYSQKPKFVTYCRQKAQDETNKLQKQKLESCIRTFFRDLILQKNEQTENADEKRPKILEIRKIGWYSTVPRYEYVLENHSFDPAKTKIEIHRMAVSREENQRLVTTEGVLNVRELEFPKVATLEIPETEEILDAFPLANNMLLLVCNERKVSKSTVYNLSNVNRAVLNMPFGKNVSSASFDCKSRVLAIQSDIEPGIVQLFKFGEDFKSRQNLRPVDLNRMFGVETIVQLCLQPNSKFFWFFSVSDGRLRKMDYKNGTMVKAIKLGGVGETTLKCTSDGSCVIAIQTKDEAWPVMTDTGTILEKVEGVSRQVSIFSLCNQILAVTSLDSCFCVHRIVVTGAQHETKLSKSLSDHQKTDGSEKNTGGFEEHWINYIYWMYTKFPCNDLLATNQDLNNFWITIDENCFNIKSKVSYELSRILGKIQKTRKPTDYMKIHVDTFEASLSKITDMHVIGTPVGTFLKRLITFVPIQIARCQSNEFSILDNGQTVSLESVNVAFDLMEKINLGFYESIFSAWNGNVKVISSMGKQTTGKSYTLNHLTGSSFNIAGTRCTDGCWMTVKEQDDCLYVILDFEGLGSFERTEQDDMLLSLFNSAVSTTTIFKTEKRLDRDVDKMFNKINMGSDQLKGNEKVFKGKFMIVINDVAEQDVKDTPKEFEEKISNIVSKSENNFIKKLYNSDFEIMAFPAFESREYYENTANLLSIVQDEIAPIFRSGPEFLGTVKLLMAKLAISDFSPLDRQQIDERVRFIRSILPFAIQFGQISDESPKKKELDLRSFDDSTFRIALKKEIDLSSIGTVELNDFDTIFKENQLDASVMQFLAIMEPNSENFVNWRSGLQNFLTESITFRFERVKEWLEANLQKWKSSDNAEYDDIINVVMENLENQKACFEQTYKFCEEKCTDCFLKCTQIVNHKSGHKCSTSHLCTAQCEYCENVMNKCKVSFGHDGKHVCREINHVCSEPCKFSELSGCAGECQKMNGHEDEHECSEKRHPCKEVCTLDGCEGRCIIDCYEEHTVHKCSKEQCINKCSVSTCTNKCAALDHFHGTESSSKFMEEQGIAEEPAFLLEDRQTQFDCAEHFCGKEHQCDQDCEHDGYCHVWTEKQLKDETFEGQRDTFTYSVKFAEMGEKLKCRQKLKPFTRMHDGGHSCSTEVHFCMAICPTCENICNKAVNHEHDGDLLHHARHGNMRKCFFVATEDDIQVGTHKYKVGEPAVAEMCHIFCNTLGRGHIHIVECDSEDPTACVYSAKDDRRRHESTKYQPNPEVPKDEITHEAYWASIGFQDPCQEIDAEDFEKCPAYCAAEVHEKEDEQTFCEMSIWHNPVKSLADVNRTSGFLTKDGHVFPCSHPSGVYHFVLCLDDSGSMTGNPWNDLVTAVNAFVAQRQSLPSSASSEMISIVIYNSVARIAAEYQPMSSFSRDWLKFNSGGTDFSIALTTADQIVGRHLDKNIKPVLIFMSDGGSYNGEVEMEQLARNYRVSNGLEVYTLGFGSIQFEKLRELARLGKGQFLEAVNGLDLRTTFVEISAKHPANIGVSF